MGSTDSAPLLVEVLGPLRVFVDGLAVDVRGPKRRAVVAMLALAEGRTVTIDHLLDALWPTAAPELGRQTMHTHVSRLRIDLGAAAARLVTGYDGYRLDLGSDDLDVTKARALLAAARTAKTTQPDQALGMLRAAHTLWRGPMLADLTDIPPIETAVEGYRRLHREVTDALITCSIDAGQADAVLGLAATSFAEDPLREPAVLLMMRALSATGQAAEALHTGREYRHRLAEETGLDPSPVLSALERDIASGATAAQPAPPKATVTAAASTTVGPRAQPAADPRHGRRDGRPPGRPITRLIGREAQVAALHRILADQRLVTVIGPGGVGKSRVALAVAGPSGPVTVVLLASITDPMAIPHALAAALKLTDVHGDVLAACVAVLGDEPALLVIDNCEHLLDAVRDVIDIVLAACPGVTVLATSRERLGLGDEYAFRLTPLQLPTDRDGPDPDPALEFVPAVALFLDRAGRVRPGPPPKPDELRLVADIVRRLDGMPLAIELAAGRLSTFSLPDLHQRLDRALDLLGGGRISGDLRHRTLRATIEWSYQLLPAAEQRLFRQLAIFVDGVDLTAAEQLGVELCPDSDPGSVLARLVDASMIDADLAVGTRYRMLETLRSFGIDRLVATGEDAAAEARFLRWAVQLAEWLQATLRSEREPIGNEVLRRELPNLRAAWRLARGSGALDEAAEIVIGLFDAIAFRDLLEIRRWAEDLADDPALAAHPRAAAVLGTAAEAAYHRGDYQRADQLARSGLKSATDNIGSWLCLSALSVADLARGAFADAGKHAQAAARLSGRPADNLVVAALAATYAGDLGAARQLNEQVLAAAVSPTSRSWCAYVAGEIESADGRGDLADGQYVRAIELAREAGATFTIGVATVGLLSVRVAAGRIPEALTGYREVIDYFDRAGNWTHQWTTLRNLAGLLRRLGDHEPADLLEAAANLAPDAPADGRLREVGPDEGGAAIQHSSRSEILAVARQAIGRNLGGP
jgi:predicted ATPase/DNA-binding SARP family transcriptional activator